MVSPYFNPPAGTHRINTSTTQEAAAEVSLSLRIKDGLKLLFYVTTNSDLHIFTQVASCSAGLRSSWCTRREPSV